MTHIAITGHLRSGKDSVGEYLVRNYGYTQFAFGDALKDDFHRRYPEIPREPKPRIGYQNHGQLMRALIGEDVWIDACFGHIDAIDAEEMYTDAPPFRAVITDLRQPNEYERCRAEGCAILRVKSSSANRIARAIAAGDSFNPKDLAHETESYVDTFDADYEITNDGTLNELYAQIDGIMRELGVEKAGGTI